MNSIDAAVEQKRQEQAEQIRKFEENLVQKAHQKRLATLKRLKKALSSKSKPKALSILAPILVRWREDNNLLNIPLSLLIGIARSLDKQQWEAYRPWFENSHTEELKELITFFPTLPPDWTSFLRLLQDRELEVICCAEFTVGYFTGPERLESPERLAEWKSRLQRVAEKGCSESLIQQTQTLASADAHSVPELTDQDKSSKRCRSDSDPTLRPVTAGISPSVTERQSKRVALDSTSCLQSSAHRSADLRILRHPVINGQDQNSSPSMECPRRKNNTPMAIDSLVNHTTNSHNRTLEDEDAPVHLESTVDGWGEAFAWVNYIHDVAHDQVFNVPDTPEVLEPGSQLEADIRNLQEKGFLHWNDDFAAGQIELLRGSYFWDAVGLHRFWSVLQNARLQNTIHKWFRSKPAIWHCTWWCATGNRPIYLKRNTGATDDRCLGIHILPRDTDVRYLTGSHTATWPDKALQSSGVFSNFEDEIHGYEESKPLSGGFTLFDPKVNLKIESSWAMTIVLGPQNTSKGWTRLEVRDETLRQILASMEKVIGIGWNLH